MTVVEDLDGESVLYSSDEAKIEINLENYYCFKLVVIGYNYEGDCDVLISDCINKIYKDGKKSIDPTSEGENMMSVFPNPTSGADIFVSFSDLDSMDREHTFQIIDAKGAVISDGTFMSQSLNSFDTSSIAKGNYVLLIQDIESGKLDILKFSKQ